MKFAPSSRRIDASADACEAFIRWYSSTGHWVYDDRAHAARTWIERGITTLSPAPANAGPLLADWVAADEMPALVARLRADEAAQRAAAASALWLPLEVNHG